MTVLFPNLWCAYTQKSRVLLIIIIAIDFKQLYCTLTNPTLVAVQMIIKSLYKKNGTNGRVQLHLMHPPVLTHSVCTSEGPCCCTHRSSWAWVWRRMRPRPCIYGRQQGSRQTGHIWQGCLWVLQVPAGSGLVLSRLHLYRVLPTYMQITIKFIEKSNDVFVWEWFYKHT